MHLPAIGGRRRSPDQARQLCAAGVGRKALVGAAMSWLGLRALSYLFVVGLVMAALFSAYKHGVKVTDDKWKAANAELALRQANALVAEVEKARAQERSWQQNSDQVEKNAREQGAAAAADGVVADGAGDRVRDAASKLAATAGEVSCNTGAAERSASAARAAMVLSDLFERADRRAGELAKAFDQSRIAGLACQAAYDSLLGAQQGAR